MFSGFCVDACVYSCAFKYAGCECSLVTSKAMKRWHDRFSVHPLNPPSRLARMKREEKTFSSSQNIATWIFCLRRLFEKLSKFGQLSPLGALPGGVSDVFVVMVTRWRAQSAWDLTQNADKQFVCLVAEHRGGLDVLAVILAGQHHGVCRSENIVESAEQNVVLSTNNACFSFLQ